MDKIIVVNKPVGLTSNDVVQIIKKCFKLKKVGHAGTLDPNASGLLILGINEGTKLLTNLILDDKQYVATIQFGYATETYDSEGKITNRSNNKVDLIKIESILSQWKTIQELNQIPPIYSAIKLNGKKLYEYARDNIKVQLEPRKVKLFDYKILSFDYDNQILKIKLDVSKGFYIRSFAYDLGIALDNFATLIGLVRTKSGQFELEDAIDFNFDKFIKSKNN